MKKNNYNTGSFPLTRMRRNRSKGFSRRLIKENHLSVDDLILPLFITKGKNISEEIKSMPGVFRSSPDRLLKLLEEVVVLGIPAVALFPYTEKDLKDNSGTIALREDNLVCQTVRLIKKEFPKLGVICDVALDPYTDHGHDGIVIDGEVDNDRTKILVDSIKKDLKKNEIYNFSNLENKLIFTDFIHIDQNSKEILANQIFALVKKIFENKNNCKS